MTDKSNKGESGVIIGMAIFTMIMISVYFIGSNEKTHDVETQKYETKQGLEQNESMYVN